MIRGTTAQFRFKLPNPYTKEDVQWITMKFWQPGNNKATITKDKSDCFAPITSREICVSLTAEETLLFSDKLKAKVQFRGQLYKGDDVEGTVFGNRMQTITVYPINEELSKDDVIMPAENDEGWIVLDGESIVANSTE